MGLDSTFRFLTQKWLEASCHGNQAIDRVIAGPGLLKTEGRSVCGSTELPAANYDETEFTLRLTVQMGSYRSDGALTTEPKPASDVSAPLSTLEVESECSDRDVTTRSGDQFARVRHG